MHFSASLLGPRAQLGTGLRRLATSTEDENSRRLGLTVLLDLGYNRAIHLRELQRLAVDRTTECFAHRTRTFPSRLRLLVFTIRDSQD